jgi:hypothetical protein
MTPAARCYTIDELLAALKMPERTFLKLRRAGKLPFLEELRPRLGHRPRYRADLVDRYLAGEWGQSRYLSSHRRKVAV